MTRTLTRSVAWTVLAALGCAVSVACVGAGRGTGRPSPTEAGLRTADLVDPTVEPRGAPDLSRLTELTRRRPPTTSSRSVLVLSGGGAYGAYTSGVLVGWSSVGGRPCFDVVTGVSTGALIAPFAFLGPKYDPILERFYTSVEGRDLYRIRPVRGLRTESLADNRPLAETIEELITPEVLREIATEHARGRRLYVGTTELESRRQVIWDLTAIAARGRPEDLALFRAVMLASAAIPGLFPPVHIPVEVAGRPFEERHVDGGVTAALFFRPPAALPGCDPPLAGTTVFVIVAAKLYPDPQPVRPRALAVARSGVAAALYSQTRGDLVRLYTICALTGMNYFQTSIPTDAPAPRTGTDFDSEVMARLFEVGVREARSGMAWRTTPPGAEPGEGPIERAGTELIPVPAPVSPFLR